MNLKLLQESEYFENLFNAVPSPVFIVDPDVRLYDYNSAAAGLLGQNRELFYMRRGGDVINCFHSTEAPEGCGRADACRRCVIRNSVAEAVRGGRPSRSKARVDLVRGFEVTPMHLLVTASPFTHQGETLVLLILEDISEMIRLQSILPICSWCKKIRTDENYWESVETYFESRIDVDFSHAICEECLRKEYPELAEKRAKEKKNGPPPATS